MIDDDGVTLARTLRPEGRCQRRTVGREAVEHRAVEGRKARPDIVQMVLTSFLEVREDFGVLLRDELLGAFGCGFRDDHGHRNPQLAAAVGHGQTGVATR